MGYKESNLSSPKYGYDLSVGTTQQSINSTMKAYLSTLSQPLMRICYVADDAGNPQQIEFDELLKLADGSDPFTISPSADPKTNRDLINLEKARFMVGFKARIGLPPKYRPEEIPDIVTFGLSHTNVTFKLMCAEFTVVNLKPSGGYSPASWLSISQGSSEAWFFESTVDIRQVAVNSDRYYTLPPDVQHAISKFHAGSFGVQQLLFDLNNAALQSVPKILGVDPGSILYSVLQQYFIGNYFVRLQTDGQPVLGCSVRRIDPDLSSLDVTNVQMQVGPHVDGMGQVVPNPTEEQRQLSTLNYLCMISNGNPLPPVPYSWNWLHKDDVADGVVALNRNAFARHIRDQLYYLMAKTCYKPWVEVSYEWTSGTTWYSWDLEGNQTPTVTLPEAGPIVITSRFQQSASDYAGAKGAPWGKMKLEPSFDVDVTFIDNTIVIVQHLKIYLYIEYVGTGEGGNVVDIKLTNTYTLGVDDNGRLTSVMTPNEEDNSELPNVNGFLDFFLGINELIEDVKEWASEIADTSLEDLPLSVVQSFIFPGGNSFVFKDVVFSDNQDLVSRVTYADPSKKLWLTRHGRPSRRPLQVRSPAHQGRPLPLPMHGRSD